MSERPRLNDIKAVRVTSHELAKNGASVRAALNAAYGGELRVETTNQLYGDLMSGALVGWALVGAGDDGVRRMCGLLLGRIVNDRVLGKHLYLPAMNVAASVPLAEYRGLFQSLEAFARSQGCGAIYYLTESKAAATLGQQVGFRRNAVVMRKDV